MAGIVASSASANNVGDTAVDKALAGFVADEEIVFTTSPTGTNYAWSLAKPSASTDRAALSATSGASVKLTPDVAGDYTVRCNVDGTDYVIRCSVVQIAVANSVNGVRLIPTYDAAIPTPATGKTLYMSIDQDALTTKDSAGALETVNTTTV